MKKQRPIHILRFLIIACLSLFAVAAANAGSTSLVISQVYGGGGNAGATYKNDFIELRNVSGSPITFSNYSVQYASSAGTTWSVTPISGTIQPGGYFLIQEAAGTGGTQTLTPDATGSTNMSATAGKVALVANATALSGGTPPASSFIDLVGFGTANYFEGSGPAPTLSNTTAALRKNNGLTDTDDNASDFTAGAPNPRNSSFLVATTVQVETAADGSGVVMPAQNLTVGASLTAYAVSRSSTSADVANVAATWSLTSITGGVVSGDLVPAADNRSATFTPHAQGSAVIHAVFGSLTSVDSGVITAVPAPTNPTGVASVNPATATANQSVTITVTVTPGSAGSAGMTVTGDLSSIGESATQAFSSSDNTVFTSSATLPANVSGGTRTLSMSIVDGQGHTGSCSATLRVLGPLTVLHMNDMHARIMPHYWQVPGHDSPVAPQFELVGGAPCFATEMLQLKTANPDALVLDAGDISEGNPLGDMNGNGSMVQFYQLLDTKLKALGGRGIDAMVLGNHDVRFKSYIDNLKNQTNFPVISINICAKGTLTPYFQPYVIVTVNGEKIGILGYTTGSSQIGTDLATILDLVPCDWNGTDPTHIHVSNYVNELRNAQGCDLVILLTHSGHTELCAATPPVIADTADAKVPEIAITGHWHTYCDTVWQPSILNYKTTFTESGSYVHYIGELHATGAGKYVSCTQHPIRNSEITPDPDVTNLLTDLETQYAGSGPAYGLQQIIGYTADDLMLDKRMKWWSSDEFPWDGDNTAGEWICDALQWKAIQLFGQCDLSIEAGGGVRSDIPRGAVTYTQIYETYPWSDDTIYVVKMTGQEIYNYLFGHGCDVGLSQGWHVTAHNCNPTLVTFNGQPIGLNTIYKVAISNYMYANDTVPFTDPAPQTSTYLARQSLVDYTSQFTADNPLHMGGSRYTFDTEFSGGFRAVVTMMNDADSSTTFDDAFIRLLSATPETLLRVGSRQVPADLVNTDGSINHINRLSEQEMYRSFLGFKTGALHPGDIIETYGKGGAFNGNPEFVDQEGVYGDGVEFNIVDHDASLAQPRFYSAINSFWDDVHTNQYVKFLAKKADTSTVRDENGTVISISDVTGFASKTLPGNVGDLLLLTGVPTSESFGLSFRCDSAVLASTAGITSYPPDSHVNTIAPAVQTGPTLTLTATAGASVGNGLNTITLTPTADSQVELGVPTSNFGTKSFLFVQSSSTSTFKDERSWLKFDLSSVPAGTVISSATLHLYCWSATGAALPAAICGGTSDSWTETGLNWNNQPGFGSALDTQTLASGVTSAWYAWDATSFVQGKFAASQPVSLVLKAVTEGAPDATAPGYGFESKEFTSNKPYLEIDSPISGPLLVVAQVQFFYRYSSDGQTWGAWTADQTITSAPWTETFSYPNGFGYYQFYSIATDSAGAVEPAPPFADASVQYVPAALPVVTIAATSPSASEAGPSTGIFTLTRSGSASGALQVFYGIAGTALNGEDYSSIPTSVTIPDGSASTAIVINPASDLVLEGDRTVTLTVLSGAGYTVGNPDTDTVTVREFTLDGWRKAHFSNSDYNDSTISGAMAVPFHDGVSNLLKYALNLDPTRPDADGLPTVGFVDGALSITYTVVKGATDIQYLPEVSLDMSSWNSGSSYTAVSSVVDNGPTQTVTVISLLPSNAPTQFIHLKVTQP